MCVCVVYFIVVKSRRMRWTGYVGNVVDSRDAYRDLVRRPYGKRPFGRPWLRWEDNIKIDLQGVEWGRMDWIALA